MESAEAFGFGVVLKFYIFASDIVILSEGNFGGHYPSKLSKFWKIS